MDASSAHMVGVFVQAALAIAAILLVLGLIAWGFTRHQDRQARRWLERFDRDRENHS